MVASVVLGPAQTKVHVIKQFVGLHNIITSNHFLARESDSQKIVVMTTCIIGGGEL